jgi:hypothetical protein
MLVGWLAATPVVRLAADMPAEQRVDIAVERLAATAAVLPVADSAAADLVAAADLPAVAAVAVATAAAAIGKS